MLGNYRVAAQLVAIGSIETPVLTKVILRHIPEDDLLHSHRRENLKYNIASSGFAL
jgi:hypothetical protein